MSSEKTEYRLSAIDSFVCIGSECPASCCCGKWSIPVEEEFYLSWQQVPDLVERARLTDSVVRVSENGHEILRMNPDETGCCRLLGEDGLCTLQQRHGESLMPSVCRTYPRMVSETHVSLLSTLSLSCPEVARLVLFTVNQPVFKKISPLGRGKFIGEDLIRHELTELLDGIMTESKYPLAARIFYLADAIVRLSRLSIQNLLNTTTLRQTIKSSKNDLYQIGVALKEHRLRPVPAVAGSFWHTLVRIGRSQDLLPELDAASPLLVALAQNPTIRTEQYIAAHAEIQRLRSATQGIWRTFDTHFIRYLHTTLMYHGFPWNPAVDNYIASFIRAMLPFSLTRLRLWLRAEKQGSLQDQDVRDIVYQVERNISHSKRVLIILDRNPELLELGEYHTTLLDL